MKKFALALLAMSISTPALAESIALKCTIQSEHDGEIRMDVLLNETAGTVGYTFPDNGRSYSTRALFTSNEVRFGAFIISRVDLSITRVNSGMAVEVLNRPPRDHGTCVKDAAERAF